MNTVWSHDVDEVLGTHNLDRASALAHDLDRTRVLECGLDRALATATNLTRGLARDLDSILIGGITLGV
jgi:hypothetical protein